MAQRKRRIIRSRTIEEEAIEHVLTHHNAKHGGIRNRMIHQFGKPATEAALKNAVRLARMMGVVEPEQDIHSSVYQAVFARGTTTGRYIPHKFQGQQITLNIIDEWR